MRLLLICLISSILTFLVNGTALGELEKLVRYKRQISIEFRILSDNNEADPLPHSRPFQVGLIMDDEHFCGGSLISKTYVLTAAHCLKGRKKVDIILGAHKIEDDEPTQVRLTTTDFIIHPEFNENDLENDIALIKLPSEVSLTSSIKLVPLAPSSSGTFAGKQSILSGWGKTGYSDGLSNNLQEIDLIIISNEKCAELYGGKPKKSNVLCAYGNGTKGGCNGDSGGPLTVKGIQVGIVSSVHVNCTPTYPTVFTRISSFKDWLESSSDIVNI